MRSNDVVTREDPGDAVANNNNNAGTHGTSFECVLRTKTFRIPPILLPIDEDNPDLRKTNRILVVDRDASGIKSTSEGLWCTEAVDTLPTVSGTVLVDTLGQAIASSFETKYRLPRHEVWTNSKNDDNDDDADYSIMTRSTGTALTYGDISLDSIEEEEFEQFMKDYYHSEEEEFEQFMKDYYHSKAPLTKIGEDIFDSNNNNDEDYSSSIFAYITSCCSLLPLSAYFQINIDDTDFVGNNSREHVIKKSGTGILEASNHSLNEFPSYDEYRKKKQSNSRANNNDDRYDEDTVDDDGTEQQRDAPPTPSSFPQNISPIHVKVDNSDAENYRDNTKINSSSRRKNNNNGNSTKKTMFSKRKLRLWWTKKNDKKIGSADAAAVTTTNNNEAVVSASGTTLSLNENIEEKDEKEKMFNVDDDSNNKQEHQKQLKGDGNDDENETEWTSTNDILVLTPSMNRASMALQWANVSYMESPLSSSSTRTSNSSSEIDGGEDKRTENNVELLLVGSDCTEDSVFETVYCKQKTITSILPESKNCNVTTTSTIDPPQEPQDDTSINSIAIPSPVTQPTQSPTPTPTPKPKIATTAIATTETQLVPPSLLEEDNINTTNTKIVLNNLVSDFFGTIKTNFNKEKMTTKKISKDNNKAGEEEEVEEVQQQQNEDDTNADGLCVGTTFLENSVLEQFETTLSCGGGGYSCDPSSSVLDTVQDSLGASSDRLVFHGRATEATCTNKNKEKEATTSKEEEEEEVPDEEAYRTNDEQQPIPHNVSVTTIPVCRFVTTEIILPKNANTNIDEKHRPVLRLVTTKSNGDSKQIVYAAKDKNFDKGKRSSSSEKNERKEGKVEDVSKKERKLSAKSASNIQQDVHENSTIALDATDDTDDKRTETETVDYEEMEGSGRIVSIVPLLSSPLSTRMIIETKDSVISAPMGSRF